MGTRETCERVLCVWALRYKNRLLCEGDHFGELIVSATVARTCKTELQTAMAITYLHVHVIDVNALTQLEDQFPKAYHATKHFFGFKAICLKLVRISKTFEHAQPKPCSLLGQTAPTACGSPLPSTLPRSPPKPGALPLPSHTSTVHTPCGLSSAVRSTSREARTSLHVQQHRQHRQSVREARSSTFGSLEA